MLVSSPIVARYGDQMVGTYWLYEFWPNFIAKWGILQLRRFLDFVKETLCNYCLDLLACALADYGFTKLIELYEAIPQYDLVIKFFLSLCVFFVQKTSKGFS